MFFASKILITASLGIVFLAESQVDVTARSTRPKRSPDPQHEDGRYFYFVPSLAHEIKPVSSESEVVENDVETEGGGGYGEKASVQGLGVIKAMPRYTPRGSGGQDPDEIGRKRKKRQVKFFINPSTTM